MGLIFWMLEDFGSCKGFFTIKPAQRADGVHTQREVGAYIDKCIAENAMAGLDLAGGIGDMWRDEKDKKLDDKGTLLKMRLQAECQINIGYLTPSMLDLLDTVVLCCAGGCQHRFQHWMWGGEVFQSAWGTRGTRCILA